MYNTSNFCDTATYLYPLFVTKEFYWHDPYRHPRNHC